MGAVRRDGAMRNGSWNMSGRQWTTIGTTMTATWLVGCASGARVQLATADSMDLIRGAMSEALAEYHADLATLDAQRRDAAVDALLDRLHDAPPEQVDAHADAFRAAMTRLDTDRETAWRRYAASQDTVALLGEIAAELRRFAAESQSFDDETRRYFSDLVQQHKDRKVRETVSRTRDDRPAIFKWTDLLNGTPPLLGGAQGLQSAPRRARNATPQGATP